jgi:hypothetical protein
VSCPAVGEHDPCYASTGSGPCATGKLIPSHHVEQCARSLSSSRPPALVARSPDPQGCRWLAGLRSTFVQLDGGDELDEGATQPDTDELIEQPAHASGLGHLAGCDRRNEAQPVTLGVLDVRTARKVVPPGDPRRRARCREPSSRGRASVSSTSLHPRGMRAGWRGGDYARAERIAELRREGAGGCLETPIHPVPLAGPRGAVADRATETLAGET